MSKFFDWLKGKRTIIVNIGAIFATVGAYLGGEITITVAGAALWLALTAIYAALKGNAIKDALNGVK